MFTVDKPKPDRNCLHMHFHCEAAVAQHEVATKSATHVILIRGQPCSVAVALKEISDPRSLWDQTTAQWRSSMRHGLLCTRTQSMVCSVAELIAKMGECLLTISMLCSIARVAQAAKAFCTWDLHCLGLKVLPSVVAANHPSRHEEDSLASGANCDMSACSRSTASQGFSQFVCQTLLCEWLSVSLAL